MHPIFPHWTHAFRQERVFWDAFDADYLFDLAGRLSAIGTYELGFRPSGSPAGHRAADLILEEMRRLGLQAVRKEAFPVYAWDFAGASLQVEGWPPVPACGFPPTPGTPAQGLTASLVDVGQGTAPDYLGQDLRNKIAFVHFDLNRLPWMDVLAHEAELHGACALVFYYRNGYAQHESGEALNTHNGEARPSIPILQIAKRDGARLADRLAANGPLKATLHSEVTADPDGTGHNIVGEIPGRAKDSYLIVNGHYDAWFHGYWDNAIGVAAMLAVAKTLLESNYRPEHTLLFTATDAEEFGAPDTQFDWLTGCYSLLRSHPEWHERVSAAFNIDTLAFRAQDQLGFITVPELLPFLRKTAGAHKTTAFPKPETWVKELVTAWTETLTYAYFGIPPLQPRGSSDEAKSTIYHTQFDEASIVNREGAVETIQLYGSTLLRFDRQPILPYDFAERAKSLRSTLDNPPNADAETELSLLNDALDGLETKARQLNDHLARTIDGATKQARNEVNDLLRVAVAYLVENINYLNPSDPDEASPPHVFFARDLRALDAALRHLDVGDVDQAITALIDRKSGLRGASYALDISYPVYYRRVVDVCSPGRDDLFWATGRTATLTDVWGVLHTLQDKSARNMTDYGAERITLESKRQHVAEAYRDAIRQLVAIVDQAATMLPTEGP